MNVSSFYGADLMQTSSKQQTSHDSPQPSPDERELLVKLEEQNRFNPFFFTVHSSCVLPQFHSGQGHGRFDSLDDSKAEKHPFGFWENANREDLGSLGRDRKTEHSYYENLVIRIFH